MNERIMQQNSYSYFLHGCLKTIMLTFFVIWVTIYVLKSQFDCWVSSKSMTKINTFVNVLNKWPIYIATQYVSIRGEWYERAFREL